MVSKYGIHWTSSRGQQTYVDHPAWGLGEGLSSYRKNNQLITKCYTGKYCGIGGACSKNMRDEKRIQNFGLKTWREENTR